jgi:hypothetical protein
MWNEKKKEWIHHTKSIIAANATMGEFLACYLTHVATNNLHVHHLEVIDMHTYKVIKQPKKVRTALKERVYIPFVFPIGKN